MNAEDKILLSKSSLILKEIVNTVPTAWFKGHSAQKFRLDSEYGLPSLVFSVIVGFEEKKLKIIQQHSLLYTISVFSGVSIETEIRDIQFRELGKNLETLL